LIAPTLFDLKSLTFDLEDVSTIEKVMERLQLLKSSSDYDTNIFLGGPHLTPKARFLDWVYYWMRWQVEWVGVSWQKLIVYRSAYTSAAYIDCFGSCFSIDEILSSTPSSLDGDNFRFLIGGVPYLIEAVNDAAAWLKNSIIDWLKPISGRDFGEARRLLGDGVAL